MTRAQNLAVVVTCLLAATTNAGAVTTFGLLAFVLPGVLGAALIGSFLAARRLSAAALIVGGFLLLGWAELVNIWSGTADGPAARATFLAAGCTLVGVVVARSASPALFLVTIAAAVCGAMLLGAGGEVRIVAVAAAVSAALTLGWIERSRRNWTARPRRGAAPVLLSLLVGAVAAGVVLLQAQQDPIGPEALKAGQAYPHLKPAWTDPLAKAAKALGAPPPPPARRKTAPPPPAHSQTKPHTNPPQSSRHNPPPKQRHNPPPPPPKTAHHPHRTPPHPTRHVHKQTPSSRIWLYVLAGILLLALVVAARLLAVRMAWRRLRRRLATGAPAEQITGAWAWARMRLEAFRLPLPVAVSPDVVAAGGIELPAEVFVPLQALATATTSAAFANEESISARRVDAAWTDAGRTEVSARELLTRRARLVLAFRGPARRMRTR